LTVLAGAERTRGLPRFRPPRSTWVTVFRRAPDHLSTSSVSPVMRPPRWLRSSPPGASPCPG